MTWTLTPDSADTARVIELIKGAGRPMARAEIAAALGLGDRVGKMHLALAREQGAAFKVGGGAQAAWATKEVAAAAREALYAEKCARRRDKLGWKPAVKPGAPVRVRRSTWEPVTVAPGPNSVFALAGTLT